ncbi:MAG: hypothetical protein RIR49_1527 [Actinomycetota bacterium]|jgi:phosphatidylglycerophosphatase C
MTIVAAFDLDGTLTERDCVVPFLTRASGRVRLGRATIGGIVTSPSALRSRDRLKAIGASALRGESLTTVEDLAARFATETVTGWLRTDTLDRLTRHQEAGHLVVIVSASFAVYAEPLGTHLGVDAVLATQLASIDGILTGELHGPNCRGPVKVDRLVEWLGTRGLRRDEVTLHAYGDSAGDREMLLDADVATRVAPVRRRRRS